MDNSQSSDVFSDNGNYSRESSTMMDITSYEALLSNTKLSLSKSLKNEVTKQTFCEFFTSVLEDCATCIYQSLDLLTNQLTDPEVQTTKLYEYMEDTVCLLQLLSNFIKGVLETVTMSCCSMKTFPTSTGRIILTIFSHCKDSETLYGVHLKSVEKQLKDLFRMCHDLQLTYLMILERHFIFDLADFEEVTILLEALDINLKIGTIVEALDVKTMAEQWKAFSFICEKYSTSLKDKHIYQDCMKILSSIIENNLKFAIESDQEEKVATRSLKVASFTIKILLKLCITFKHGTFKNYERLVELLIYVYSNNIPSIQLKVEKSSQFYNQLANNISIPTEVLLKELLSDEIFVNHVLQVDISKLNQEERLLGYMFLIISIIKAVVQKNEEVISKHQLTQCVFRLLPFGHLWFNIGLKLKSEANSKIQTNGLFEHLLAHTLALCCTMTNEEVKFLEKYIYEAILSLECYSAVFSSSLLSLFARLSHRQYALSQLFFLCKSYQTLESNKLFAKSPQEVHLSFTISKIFNAINDEDKLKIFKQFNIDNEKNSTIWYCLKVRNLPRNLQHIVEKKILDKLSTKLERLCSSGAQSEEDMDNITNLLKLANTCSFVTNTGDLEDQITNAWLKACPVNNPFIIPKGDLKKGVEWYLDYIEALVSLTVSMKDLFQRSSNLVKILHTSSKMIERGNTELKLVLIDLVYNLSPDHMNDGNKTVADTILIQTFKNIMQQDVDTTVRNKFLNEVCNPRHETQNQRILKILKDNSLRQIWNTLTTQRQQNTQKEIKDRLELSMPLSYRHKCLGCQVTELGSKRTSIDNSKSNNFDFADIDTLFEVDRDSEPASKKFKHNVDIEEIIRQLEQDVTALCDVKENLSEYKNRVRKLCDKLNSLIC